VRWAPRAGPHRTGPRSPRRQSPGAATSGFDPNSQESESVINAHARHPSPCRPTAIPVSRPLDANLDQRVRVGLHRRAFRCWGSVRDPQVGRSGADGGARRDQSRSRPTRRGCDRVPARCTGGYASDWETVYREPATKNRTRRVDELVGRPEAGVGWHRRFPGRSRPLRYRGHRVPCIQW
jgi:hypothetical protein